jgi:hypothetical protein
MSILALQTAAPTGLASVNPEVIYILTSDTYATVTTTGYLTQQAAQGFTFNNYQMALVYTSDEGPVWLKVAITYSGATILNTVVSLVQISSPGDVTLPTIASNIIVSTDTVGTLANTTGTAINRGSIQAGLSGDAGTLISYSATAARGSLILAAVANTGNDNVTISNAAHGQASVYSIPDGGQATAEFIISDSAGTQHITSGALQVDAGVMSTGLSTGGTAGGFIAYPATTTQGSLRLTPVGNVGNFAATISNVAGLGQATVYTLPDPGAATANILISASAGGQTMSGGLTLSTGNFLVSAGTITSSGAITSNAGAVTSGLSAGGFVGLVKAFPTTATSGFIAMQAAANATGNFGLTLSNSTAQAQATVLTIPDVGAATGFLNAQTVTAASTPASVVITKDITLGFAALAAGGTVVVQAALATAQFKVRNIFVNYGAAGLSGGGGDRLVTLTDGTTVYNNAGITAALLGTPINTVWSGTGNPLAGTVEQSTATVAGQALRFVYSGGTTDYTAGSVVVTVTYERVV